MRGNLSPLHPCNHTVAWADDWATFLHISRKISTCNDLYEGKDIQGVIITFLDLWNTCQSKQQTISSSGNFHWTLKLCQSAVLWPEKVVSWQAALIVTGNQISKCADDVGISTGTHHTILTEYLGM